ncbi:hypothetical protein [Roseovarius autotrophicus]|uniref:hypothetical protein n=1 Tax=Roseovarius autotrophicus TaxID=2824121 RepID=UPI001B35E499|nr:hypothetical protein [Roseovarius autotrophicus]
MRDRPRAAGRDEHDAAVQLPRTGHSCIAQHLLVLSVGYADDNDIDQQPWIEMPADRDHAPNLDEINRLVALGLSFNTAIAVADGRLDEAFHIARAIEGRKVKNWCKGRKNIPHALTAKWDLNPENFYLALDGKYPGDHDSAEFAFIGANVDDVNCRLTQASSRDKDPWHRRYKWKSCGIACRWLHGNGVTPPLLAEFQGQIHIAGGMHRFHLAKHYGTTCMPFLVRKADLATVLALLPSGTSGPDHINK